MTTLAELIYRGDRAYRTHSYFTCTKEEWQTLKAAVRRKTVRTRRAAQQRKGKTVRSCKSCVRLGNEYFCQPCDGEYSNWKPRTASPVA